MAFECPIATEADYTQQLLGASPLYVPIGAREDAAGFLSVAVDTVVGQPTGTGITVQVFGEQPTDQFTVGYGNWITKPIRGKFILVKGSGATIELKVSPVRIDVAPINLPAGTQNVNIAGVGGVTQANATLNTSGPIEDAAGNILGVSYVGGSAAPANGLWRFDAALGVANTALTVDDGSGAVNIIPVGMGQVPTDVDYHTYEVQVVQGKTYTINAGTVKFGNVGGAG